TSIRIQNGKVVVETFLFKERSCLHYGFGDFSSLHVTLWTGPYPVDGLYYNRYISLALIGAISLEGSWRTSPLVDVILLNFHTM
ncbi:hypothetical protein L9F63_025406, partial [Diploptera punctata]